MTKSNIENEALLNRYGRLFQVVTNHLPAILECLSKYGDEYEKTEELRNECVKAYIEVVSEFPRTGASGGTTGLYRAE